VTTTVSSGTQDGDALDLLAGLILEDGSPWATRAEQIQWDDARAILDRTSQSRYHYLTRARGRSKTTDLAGITLAVMLTQARRGDVLYATAADKAQAQLLTNAMRGLAERSGLAHLLRFNQFKVTTHDGAVLEVLGADVAGSYGLGPNFLVVDEIAQWPNTALAADRFDALLSSMPKRRGRMVLLTTAGDPAHWSHRIRDHAMTSPGWRLHEVPGPAPWTDPVLLEDQRQLLPAYRYQRLFENQWTAGNESFTTLEDVRACIRHAGPLQPLPRTEYVIGVDLGWVHDPSVAVVAHLEPNPERGAGAPDVVWDRHEIWTGTHDNPVPFDQVEAWLLDTARTFNKATIVMDAREGVGMALRLRTERLKVEEVPFTQGVNTQLARTLLPLLRAHRLDLPDDEHLVDELVNLRITETADGQYRIEHTYDRHNDQAIAFALATRHLLNRPPPRKMELIV
jgi:phage terminase large subunit-like protein